MGALLQDVRFAVRTLSHSKGFALAAIVTVALGTGANTAIFSLVDAALLRPLPYKDPERIALIGMSMPEYKDLAAAKSFSQQEIFATNLYDVTGTGPGEQILGLQATGGLMELLGGRAALGRALQPQDDEAGTCVISDALWRRRFGGDPGVVGKSITLGGDPYRIVGVMPRDFAFPSPEYEVWVPLANIARKAAPQLADRTLRIFTAVARLAPGVSFAQAQAETDAFFDRMGGAHPEAGATFHRELRPLAQHLLGNARQLLLILLATVACVLLIACANVANLLLARTATREREIAIRAALGAGRGRVVRQLLTESALLGLAGGTLGIAFAAWGIDLVQRLKLARLPRLEVVSIDGRVLAFTLAVSLVTGILFGLAPALQATRLSLHDALKIGGHRAPKGRRLRTALVTVEVAVSLVLLIGAGLLLRSFDRLARADGGFTDGRILTFSISLPFATHPDPQDRTRFFLAAMREIRETPGVERAGGAISLPPDGLQRRIYWSAEDGQKHTTDFQVATPDFLATLGAPLLEGRRLAETDTAQTAPVVVVSRTLARRMDPSGHVVGRRIALYGAGREGETREIVGVVGDVTYSGLDDTPSAAVYTPYAQTPFAWTYVAARTRGEPLALAPALQQAVKRASPELDIVDVRTLEDRVARSIGPQRGRAQLLTLFAALALGLAAVGIYAVLANAVAQRTQEIGVRMALGAQSREVAWMVLRQGLAPVAVGIALGLAVALGATRVLSALLYGVTATDPLTFAALPIVLLGVAALASWLPARRATRVDPVVALRAE